METDPPHAILKNAWPWRIVGFNYQLDAHDRRDSFIDLTLQKDYAIRHLRFFAPRNVQMEHDIARPSRGLRICDVSARQMDGLGVRVDDVEMYPNVSFWAREILDLDAL